MQSGIKRAGSHRLETTSRGSALVFTGACWALFGMVASSPMATLLGSAILIFVVACFVTSLSQQRRHSGAGTGSKALIQTLTSDQSNAWNCRDSLSLSIAISVTVGRPLRFVQVAAVARNHGDSRTDHDAVRLSFKPRRIGDAFLQGFIVKARSTYGLFCFSSSALAGFVYRPCRADLQAGAAWTPGLLESRREPMQRRESPVKRGSAWNSVNYGIIKVATRSNILHGVLPHVVENSSPVSLSQIFP